MVATTGPSEKRARNGETKGVGESHDWPHHVVGQGAADLSSLGATSLTALWRLDVRRPRTVVQHALQEDVLRTDVPTLSVPATQATHDVVQDGINHPPCLRKSMLERAESSR